MVVLGNGRFLMSEAPLYRVGINREDERSENKKIHAVRQHHVGANTHQQGCEGSKVLEPYAE